MSLDKAIEHGKEHRKEYEDARRYVMSYRNHKSNSMARHNREVKLKKNKGLYMDDDFDDWLIDREESIEWSGGED